MDEWENTTIGDLIVAFGGSIKTGPFGTALKAAEYSKQGVPLISVKEVGHGYLRIDEKTPRVDDIVLSRLPEYILKEGDIVFGRKGAVDRSAIVRPEQDGWFLGSDGIRLRLPSKCDAHFVSFILRSPNVKQWLIQHASGSTMASLNQEIISRVPIRLPDLETQRSLAAVLLLFDNKIELNRRMNETLEAMARAIFKDWFVDFGPTRVKAEGRDPYLAPEIWDLFPDRLDDEDKPVGWKECPLKDFFQIIGGGTPKTSVTEYWGGSIPWFSVVDTPERGSVFVIDTEKNITERGLNKSSTRLISPGTTIISARGTVGNLAMAASEMTFNQSCYALRRTDETGDYFVYLAAQQMVEQLQVMAHGSVFSTITRQTFEAITLAMPSPATLEEFEQQVSPLFQRIRANVFESRTLSQTRDLLLPKLMSGEIRIKDIENLASEAA